MKDLYLFSYEDLAKVNVVRGQNHRWEGRLVVDLIVWQVVHLQTIREVSNTLALPIEVGDYNDLWSRRQGLENCSDPDMIGITSKG